MLVKSKRESIDLRARGRFGNTWDFWDSIGGYLASGYPGTVVIQYRERDSPFMRYGIDREEFQGVVEEFVRQGADHDKMYVSPQVDTDWIALQGELTALPTGVYLHYNPTRQHMRVALQSPDSRHAEGSAALAILRHVMDGPSFDTLQHLIEEFDDPYSPWTATIEFTVCNRPVGKLGHNTIFWEVRSY